MPSRLIEAETIVCLAECHEARGVTMKRHYYAMLGRELLTEAQKNPDLPLCPSSCAQRPAQAWSWLDISQGHGRRGEKRWREKLGNPRYVPKTSEQPSAQQLMWTTAHAAIDEMLTCPKARPTAGPDFPKSCTEMQSPRHSVGA